MKIATVTPMYNSEFFVRAWAKQNAVFDENIVLMGRKPFKDYLAAGMVTEERDNTEKILREEFPHVKIYYHEFDYYSGGLFNMGMQIAEDLGCEVVYKSEPDMFMTKKDLDFFLEKIKTMDYRVLLLYFKKCTTAYWIDFEHGVPQSLWEVGNDPFVIKAGNRFVESGTQIRIEGDSQIIDWDDFTIHHFSGFKSMYDTDTLKVIESIPNFKEWLTAPQEIQDMFI